MLPWKRWSPDEQAFPADDTMLLLPAIESACTRQRLEGMEEFMTVTNKIFQQFIGNARSGLTKVVRVLLKAF